MVKDNDEVTYNISIYNEGNKEGYATKIIDQLPAGLINSPNNSSTVVSKDKSGNIKNTYKLAYDTMTNQILLTIVNTTENPAKTLKAYTAGSLDSEVIEIKCKVTQEADTKNQIILTNVAWISEAYDAQGTTTVDRDSQPETFPNVNKNNMQTYKGDSSNDEDLSKKDNFYKGEQDDDDFEKLVIMPEEKIFDLALFKHIAAISKDQTIENGEYVTDNKNIDGTYLRAPVVTAINPETGKLIVDTNTMINKDMAKQIVDAGITQVEVRSVIGCRSKHGVCQKCYGMGLARREEVSIGESIGIIAAQSIGEPGTQLTMRTIHSGGVAGVADITQGLPRVEEIFEARKPKGLAVITEIDGIVKISESKKKKEVIVTSKDDSKTYTIPFGSKLKVKDGDQVKAAQALIEGSINPAEILAIKGPEGVYEYVISEVQKVYRNQGVDINDKHIEIIARQMLRKMRVEDSGDTDMFPGSLVDMYEFEEKNKLAEQEGKRLATGKRVLLGITKASLATDSFLSAASFQETTRVLTEAAIKGKEDNLIGLKENVIIGKLIPAGTGMKRYQDVTIKVEGEDEKHVDDTVENIAEPV